MNVTLGASETYPFNAASKSFYCSTYFTKNQKLLNFEVASRSCKVTWSLLSPLVFTHKSLSFVKGSTNLVQQTTKLVKSCYYLKFIFQLLLKLNIIDNI